MANELNVSEYINIITRYWYKTDQERIFMMFSKIRFSPLKKDKNLVLNSRLVWSKNSVDTYWPKGRFLPLPFVVRTVEQPAKKDKVYNSNALQESLVLTYIFKEDPIDVSASISTIYGNIVLFAEKKTKLGDWTMTNLTKEHFLKIKKTLQ